MYYGIMGVRRETVLRGGICQFSIAAEVLDEGYRENKTWSFR